MGRSLLSKTLCALALLTSAAAQTGTRADTQADLPVDVELMLAVDVSYSMSPAELEIQRRGYAAALRDPAIWNAIANGYHQRIALTYVEWSGHRQQREVIPWTLIASPEALDRFAGALTVEVPRALRRTSIASLLDHAPRSFERNGFAGDRRAIDVSGDGPNNDGRVVTAARDDLLAAGYEINGLPLMTRDSRGPLPDLDDLDLYYENCVIGGPLSFALPVHSWEEFPPAVRQKLILELAGRRPTPRVEPAAWRGQTADGYDCLVGEKIWQLYFGDGME